MAKRTSRPGIGPFLWAAALLGWVGIALADVWDPIDQSSFATANELVHGSEQVHELGPGNDPDPGFRDVDFFRIGERPLASYEVVVDGATNDIINTLQLQRWHLTVPIQESVHVSPAGKARSLRWQNTLNSNLATSYVRVGSTSPCVSCTSAKAAYHIRSYETTYSVPRFNNSATQITLLIVQNTAEQPVTGGAHFWSPTGALLGSLPFTLNAKQVLVQNTASLAFASGASGSITVSHDGRYGDLSGKAVALEPSTGFTFDTPLEPRPR
jgi:hypothetical protein